MYTRYVREPLRIGLVGCGRIGRSIVRALVNRRIEGARLEAIHTRSPDDARAFLQGIESDVSVLSLEECASRCELLIEAASCGAVREVIDVATRKGNDLILLSSCALLEDPRLVRALRESENHVTLPSAALVGLDGVMAAREGAIDEVSLTIRRPCDGIEEAPYIVSRGIDLSVLKTETLVFEGTPVEACEGFPTRVNISASLALAGAGTERTAVRILADPKRTTHEHRIYARGSFGELESALIFPASQLNDTMCVMSLSVLATIRLRVTSLRHAT